MNDRLIELLEAHVAYELNKFDGPHLIQDISQEVDRFYRWASSITLEQVFTKDQVQALVRRLVVEIEYLPQCKEFFCELSRRFHSFRPNETHSLDTLISREMFDGFVNKSVQLEKLRDALIRFAVNSKAYHSFISEVVYAFMKDYIASENPLSQKVPGVLSLFKMGKSAVNKAIPGLEDSLEISIKAFIKTNLEKAAKLSEQSLIKNLNRDNLGILADTMWDALSIDPIAEQLRYLTPDDLGDYSDQALGFWQYYRKTTHFDQLLASWVGVFFEGFGHLTVSLVLDDWGLHNKLVKTCLQDILVPFCLAARNSGYLQEVIRDRLSSFYQSDHVADILS